MYIEIHEHFEEIFRKILAANELLRQGRERLRKICDDIIILTSVMDKNAVKCCINRISSVPVKNIHLRAHLERKNCLERLTMGVILKRALCAEGSPPHHWEILQHTKHASG